MAWLCNSRIWWKSKTVLHIVYIKTDDIYKEIAEDVENRFDTSNCELDRLLCKGKNKNVIALMEDELGEESWLNLLEQFIAKTYSYLVNDDSEDKKAKGTKKCVMKRKLKF